MHGDLHWHSRLIALVLAALLAGCSEGESDEEEEAEAPSSRAEQFEYAGRYSYVGTNPDGSAYEGAYVLEIKKTGDTYHYYWLQDGKVTDRGIAILTDDKMCVSYDQNGEPGLSILEPDGADGLTGVWTFAGNDKVGTETLTRIK